MQTCDPRALDDPRRRGDPLQGGRSGAIALPARVGLLGGLLVGVLELGGCRTGIRPADVAATSRAAAAAKRDPTTPRTYLLGSMLADRPAFPWVGTELPLSRRGPFRHERARLVADLALDQGPAVEFTVDTGTSMSCLSTFEPAAGTARRTPSDECSNFKDHSTACRATLPSLSGGGLRAATAPVLLVDRPHDLFDSTNLFGMTWMAGLALAHDVAGDRWRFVPGGSIPPRVGWIEIRMEAPALPVVRLEGPRGESVFALIDTGAPSSLAERGVPCGPYRLLDGTRRLALNIRATETAPWKNLDPGGRHVTVWIGLADLETRAWVMDFSTGIWSIDPAEAVVARRVPGR